MILDLEQLVTEYKCNINGVLHVGAHHGQEYSVYKKLQINPIIFIEALPHTYDILVNNVPTSCLCINTAIGNNTGNVDMFVDVANTGGSSSVLKPKMHLQQYPHITFPHKITVPITKIDLLDIPICNFINMDIQGYELEALKGAFTYLKNVDYIMLEVNRDEVYEHCAHVDEVDAFLKDYSFIRVQTHWAGGTWGDAFYIKKK
jgi:FkbM family methyltransferase